MKGKLFLILGPSGVGKTSLINLLRARHPDFFYPVSSTTREKRPGETEGAQYHFVSPDAFQDSLKKGDFLEYALVHQQSYYGIPRLPVIEHLEQGDTLVREVDIQGFEQVVKQIPSRNRVSIFLTVSNQQELVERILGRAPMPPEEVQKRLISMRIELAKARECDYLVENKSGELEKTVEKVEKIIQTETLKKG